MPKATSGGAQVRVLWLSSARAQTSMLAVQGEEMASYFQLFKVCEHHANGIVEMARALVPSVEQELDLFASHRKRRRSGTSSSMP